MISHCSPPPRGAVQLLPSPEALQLLYRVHVGHRGGRLRHCDLVAGRWRAGLRRGQQNATDGLGYETQKSPCIPTIGSYSSPSTPKKNIHRTPSGRDHFSNKVRAQNTHSESLGHGSSMIELNYTANHPTPWLYHNKKNVSSFYPGSWVQDQP